MENSYLKIYLITIIPAAILFFSNIDGSKVASAIILFGGFLATFVEWKQDEDFRIKEFFDKYF
ncbi:MAG TPA: hypothetical protein K8U92_02855 [Aliarcobacter thereius]|nr:hypothetical protein [Aliarcobacter thereius]HJE02791.1 hypothetical protein [Aliarcobacter thereius]